jgi:oxygen-independent coproporphyrinogen-3 oxidase
MSIEIDPREIEINLANHFYSLGFNRLSIGVQDIDEKFQQSINHVQSTEFIEKFIAHAKQISFKAININLIYGLPHQTIETFTRTLNKAHEWMSTVFHCLVTPIFPLALPPNVNSKMNACLAQMKKFYLMKLAIEKLCNFGYDFIGMDHFAKPEDELSIAQKSGDLHRNFQGYITKGSCDLLGLGLSSISAIGHSFSQNSKVLQNYYQAIETQAHAQVKGLSLSQDEIIREEVIRELMRNLYIDKNKISQKFTINFDEYFTEDLPLLQTFINDGLIIVTINEIQVEQKAKLPIRNICMSFDAYMKKNLNQQRFSQVI